MNSIVNQAVEVLNAGGIILYPTDTIWGIGCDATNHDAVSKIFKLKQRDQSRGMIALVESPNRIPSYVSHIPQVAWDLIELADKPLTIIYPGAKNLATNLIAADGSIGIRVVNHAFCEKLIQRLGRPIVSTSANFSGKPAPKTFADIDTEITQGVEMVIPKEFDTSIVKKPSGIIKFGVNGEVTVIRE
jgi:L-threonylcarbamoyladenylate synthase